MEKDGIRSIISKKYRPYSSNQRVKERENLLEQDFSTNSINEKWVSDITSIHTVKELLMLYLHSKKVIGYSFSQTTQWIW